MSHFSERLRMLREEKELTQRQIGELVNVSDRVVGYWESSERFPKDEYILTKISNFFNVSVDYLLGKTDIRNPEHQKILKDLGIEYIEIAKEMRDKEISPEDMKKLIEFAESLKEKKNKRG